MFHVKFRSPSEILVYEKENTKWVTNYNLLSYSYRVKTCSSNFDVALRMHLHEFQQL